MKLCCNQSIDGRAHGGKQTALLGLQQHGQRSRDGQTELARDSAGLIGQRVIAHIVNIACAMAEQQIASPGDIDRAVQLGLGYPQGPLGWGDAVGAPVVRRVLDGLLQSTGDPRYRPSSWLTRRAALGLSLTHAE